MEWMATRESNWQTGFVWLSMRVTMTHELQTTTLETKAQTMEYFRSIADTGVMMAKPQEQ